MARLIAGILSVLIGAFAATAEDGGPTVFPEAVCDRTTATVRFDRRADDVRVAIEPRQCVRVVFPVPSCNVVAIVVCRSADDALLVLEEYADGETSSILVPRGAVVPRRPWMIDYVLLPARDGAIVSRVAPQG